MADENDEDKLMRAAALKNAQSIFFARQRAERELIEAREALERKTQELAQQQEWLRVTLASIGDAVITTDTDGNVTFANAVAEKLTGWKSTEASGQALETVLKIIHEQTRQPVRNPVAEVLKERRIVDLANHTLLISKDGTETPIEDSAAPILDDEGKILGVILVFRDVSHKREIELRLQEAEWRSRTALEIGGAGSWVWELDQDRVTGDAMLARACGIAPEAFEPGVKAGALLNAIHEEDRAEVEVIIRRAIETGESYEAEFRVCDETGDCRWMLARGRVETSLHGNPRRLLGFLMDRTDAHRAEEFLRESERRFRVLHGLNEATRNLTDPKQIIATVGQLLGEHLAISRFTYAEVDVDGDRFCILDDYTSGCASAIGDYRLSLFGAKAAREISGGKTLVINNVDEEVPGGSDADAFRAVDIQAMVCCPLKRDDALAAMMAMHQMSPRRWTTAEISLIQEVVDRCWTVMERTRAETEVRERTRLSALRGEIATQLASSADLDCSLQTCCELLVRYLGVAFARIWTVLPAEPVLELRASAGLYTHLDGSHARVPIGQFKIGRIARDQKPLLTNAVRDDPNISDPDWARREGMTSFAGYPLLSEQRTVGVIAMFGRKSLSAAILEDLAPIADSIAQCIERKRAGIELRLVTDRAESSARAVTESAERFRLLSEIVSIQVWTAREDGQLDFVNQECVQYFGTDHVERDVLGNAWAQYVHPEDLPGALHAWQKCVASLNPYEVEFRLKDREGTYRWFLVRAQAMRDETAGTAKWFGTNTDINALKIAQSEAERASRAKDDFLAALSHELRTPLTPVLMTAAALREDLSLPVGVREQLGMMERNIGLEARLIDDLLDLTRIARGKLDFRGQVCDAHSLIGLAIEIMRDDAMAKSISIRREFTAHHCGLIADPARFQQVIWNLLRNAVKFTPRGGNITVTTRDEENDEGICHLHIEVSDSGIGINSTQLEEIFLPFEQGGLTGNHRFGGVGLGLAIARAIVDLHGGRIHAESEGKNRGATFVVEFPGATEPPAGAIELPAPLFRNLPSRVPGSTKGVSRRLLLVEDHEPTLQVLSRLLARAGHQVIPVRNLSEALAAAAANTVDIVISDLGLPDGTGTELMQQLRDTYGLGGIALSGYGMDEDIARSREAGFVTHLIKPVDFHQLERALREFP